MKVPLAREKNDFKSEIYICEFNNARVRAIFINRWILYGLEVNREHTCSLIFN